MCWHRFKYATYLIGYTFILGRIAQHNIGIINELVYWDRLFAFITYELTLMLYPVWAIGAIAIVKEWREYEQAQKDAHSSRSS